MIDSQIRHTWIDYTKSLGILLVVLGHFNNAFSDINGFIYCFHMPLFFLVSGFLTSNESLLFSFVFFIKQKVRRIIVPYCLFQIICALWLLVKVVFQGQTINYQELVIGSLLGKPAQMFCVPGWYLLSFFWCNILIYLYLRLKTITKALFWCILLICFFIAKPTWFALYTVPTAFLFYYIGYEFKAFIFWIVDIVKHRPLFGIVTTILLFSIVVVLYQKIGNLDIGRDYYTNYPLLALITALIGSFGVMVLCSSIAKPIKMIEVVSSGTIVVMCLHIPIQQFLQLHIIGSPSEVYLSIISSIFIVVILSVLHIPITNKFPLLIGKKGNIIMKSPWAKK